MEFRRLSLVFSSVLLVILPSAVAQEFIQPEFCSSKNMEQVRSEIDYSSKWNDRLANAKEARLNQGTLDKDVPETFNVRAETSLPIPTMPRSAVRRTGSRGACEILADIQPDGSPTDLIVSCSHGKYKRSAKKAVKEARFAPAFQNGLPVTKFGAIFPIDFCMTPASK